MHMLDDCGKTRSRCRLVRVRITVCEDWTRLAQTGTHVSSSQAPKVEFKDVRQ